MDTAALPLTTAEADTLRHALIDYRKLLTLSAYAQLAEEIILPEVQRVDAIAEKLNLAIFYPEHIMENVDAE